MSRLPLAAFALVTAAACSVPNAPSVDPETGVAPDTGDAPPAADAADVDASQSDDGAPDMSGDEGDDTPDLLSDGDGGVQSDAADRLSFVAVTFNTGTTPGLAHDGDPDDGYGSAQAAISDEWYGNGLSWRSVIDDAAEFFATADADVVVFQEIFWPGACGDIPPEQQTGFVCEGWSPGGPSVAELVLGEGWQVMCNPGKPDKCAAVRRSFGSFRGCVDDFCLDGMDGATVPGCGSGARVGGAVIDTVRGPSLTLVNFHGSSGFDEESMGCRVQQVEQVFDELADGAPAIGAPPNLIMGDLNTDPGRMTASDPSAAAWVDRVAAAGMHFVSAVGADAPASYAGFFDIDHVISDQLVGSCWIAGISDGHPRVTSTTYFDHSPVVCSLTLED